MVDRRRSSALQPRAPHPGRRRQHFGGVAVDRQKRPASKPRERAQPALADYVGVGQVRKFKVPFATRVWPGDTVTCRGKVTNKTEKNGEKIIEGELEVVNQKGEPAIKGSFAAACA